MEPAAALLVVVAVFVSLPESFFLLPLLLLLQPLLLAPTT